MSSLHSAAFGLALLTSAVLAAAPVHSQANLVTNGGFEAGDFTGWTTGPAGDLTVVSALSPGNYDAYPAHSGDYSAQFASSAPMDDVLSQAVQTAAGSTYVFSFWLANVDDPGTAAPLNDFKVMFGNDLLLSLQDANEFSYTQYQFSAVATGPITLLTFSGRQPPGTLELDDVSVLSAVPEASSVTSLGLLLAFGLGGLVMTGRRRKSVSTE